MSATLPPFRQINFTFCGQIKTAYARDVPVAPDRLVKAACIAEASKQVDNVVHTADKDGKPCNKTVEHVLTDLDSDTYEYGLFSFQCPCDAVHMIATPFDP